MIKQIKALIGKKEGNGRAAETDQQTDPENNIEYFHTALAVAMACLIRKRGQQRVGQGDSNE